MLNLLKLLCFWICILCIGIVLITGAVWVLASFSWLVILGAKIIVVLIALVILAVIAALLI